MDYYNDYGYSTYDSYNSASSALSLVAGVGVALWIIVMATSVLLIVSMWKVFKKAGKSGWEALLPGHNIFAMCEIADIPTWNSLLFFVPFVNIYAIFIVYNGIAKKFGKSTGFAIGMILLPFIFWPMLAFSKNIEFVGETIVENAEPVNSMNFNNDVNNFEPQMPVNNAPVNEPVMQNTFGNSFAMNEAPAMNAEPVNSMNLNNDVSNFGPQMPVNNASVNEPIMQNTVDNSFAVNEVPIQSASAVNPMDFNSNVNNFGPQMPVNNAPVNEPVMQNTIDNSFAMNEVPSGNSDAVNPMNFNTRFNNTQTNPNDMFNNPNGNM